MSQPAGMLPFPRSLISFEIMTLDEALDALHKLRNEAVKIGPFHLAAIEYCRVWTRDTRNALDGKQIGIELDQARHRLYHEYKKLVKDHENF